MSVDERVAWFLEMPKSKFPRPSWIANELIAKLYKRGADRADKATLAEILKSCGDDSTESIALTDDEVETHLRDFFSYNGYTTDCNVKIFMLHFARMELFKTIRFMRAEYNDSVSPEVLYQCLQGAAGSYQGNKMAAHLCPSATRYSADSVSVEKMAKFYFSYEAMLIKDAVDGGVLSNWDIAKELLLAVQEGDMDQTRLILTHPKADANTKNSAGQTLLNITIDNDTPGDLLNLLLKSKADPNALSTDGVSPLQRALEDGNMIMMNELLFHGADINTPSGENGFTPLMTAVSQSNDVAVKRLLHDGADKNAKSKDGKTALELATDDPAIKAMLEAGEDKA